MVLDQVRGLQLLEYDGAGLVHQSPRCLVQKVRPLISYLAMHASHALLGPRPAMRPALAACQLLLSAFQFLQAVPQGPGVVNAAAIRQRGKVQQSQIDSYRGIRWWQRLRSDFTGEAGVPLVSVAANGDRLDGSRDRAMHANLKRAELGKGKLPKAPTAVGEFGPVAV